MQFRSAAFLLFAAATPVLSRHLLPNPIAAANETTQMTDAPMLEGRQAGLKPPFFTTTALEISGNPIRNALNWNLEGKGIRLNINDIRSELRDLNKRLSGTKILVVVLPTANKDKGISMKQFFPKTADIVVAMIPAQSEVGEQPYDIAGPQGALNRIANALRKFLSGESPLGEPYEYCRENNIGRIMIPGIENFMYGNLDHDPDRVLDEDVKEALQNYINSNPKNALPQGTERSVYGFSYTDAADYAFGALYDAKTDDFVHAFSRGIEVPYPYSPKLGKRLNLFDYVMNLGWLNQNWMHGAFTWGSAVKVLCEDPNAVIPAAVKRMATHNIEGEEVEIEKRAQKPEEVVLDKNWHWYVTGGLLDRYDLLNELAEKVNEEASRKGWWKHMDPEGGALTADPEEPFREE